MGTKLIPLNWWDLSSGMKENNTNIFTDYKEIFISGNVPSSKNSKVWTGKFLVNSKYVTAYKKIAVPQFKLYQAQFDRMKQGKQLPLHVEFTFIRDSKRLFDFVNMAQILLDLMQEYEWLENDNYLNVVPHFNPEVIIDKANAGVKIKIIK